MKYKSYVYLEPEGIITLGKYQKMSEAYKSAVILASYITNHSKTKAKPVIEEISPEWRFKAKNRNTFEWRCSECGDVIFGLPTNYCANCGADMRNKK